VSGGLVALLDDVAALAKLAAASIDDVGAAASKATAKAAGVVVDDTAVTPRYLQGFSADREIPAIKRIARGSVRNKLLIILPAVMVLSQFLPGLLTPILMVGGTYLCYEAVEKIWEKVAGHEKPDKPVAMVGRKAEDVMVNSAIRTDLILSAEIMVIALTEVEDEPFVTRALVLVVVAFVITAVVYGVVALIVRMDDFGLSLIQRDSARLERLGRLMVRSMPRVLAAISLIGVAAMLWVGGHILVGGFEELGWTGPYDVIHSAEEAVRDATGVLGGMLGWLTSTVGSAAFGLLVGGLVVAVVTMVHRIRGSRSAGASTPAH
jgi:predicted DNA repair protein MutK